MKNLTEGNIYKNYFFFAIPLVLSGLLTQLYNTVDTIIAGKFIGTESLAAIGTTAPFLTFLSALFWGFAAGFGICVAQLFGAKQYERIKSVIVSTVIVYIGAGTVIGLGCFLFRRQILTLLRVDPAVMGETSKYFSVIVLGIAFITLQNTFLQMLNGLGDSSMPFFFSIVSSVLNIAGNIFSVVVLKIGVLGIALSSVFSALVVDALYVLKLRRCFLKLGVADYKAKVSLSTVGRTVGFWLPTTIQQAVMYASTMLLSPMINGLGYDASASYTVSCKVYDILTCVFFSSSKTVSTYVAQAVGGKKYKNIRKGLRVGLLQSSYFLLPLLTVCVLFPKFVCGVFFRSDYTGIGITYSVRFLQYYIPFVVFNLVSNAFHAFYRGVKEMKHLVCCTFFGAFLQLVMGFFLIRFFGMYGFYAAWVISWVADAGLGFALYLTKGWRRRVGILQPYR